MLMIFGLFVFALETAPFDKMRHQTEWRWACNDRVGTHPAYQFLGRGGDRITLEGTLMPEYSGGPVSLDMLRTMAEAGKPYLLIGGTGRVYGYWIAESIDETRSMLLRDGQAQKITFSLRLVRYDGDHAGLGALTPLLPTITGIG